MRSGLIAQKLGMTRIYTDEGVVVPVTVLKVDNCQVVAQKTNDKDGYTALQLGAGVPKIKRLTKAERGHFAVAKVEPKRKLKEFRVSPDNVIPVGAEITVEHFVPGQFVDVTATSMGKGFAEDDPSRVLEHREPFQLAKHLLLFLKAVEVLCEEAHCLVNLGALPADLQPDIVQSTELLRVEDRSQCPSTSTSSAR